MGHRRAALVLASLMLAGLPSNVAAQALPYDLVMAAGSTSNKEFIVQASNGLAGLQGTVFVHQTGQPGCCADLALVGRVVCVSVAGNNATVGLVILAGTGSAQGEEGRGFWVYLRRGADPLSGQFGNSGFGAPPPTACPIFLGALNPATGAFLLNTGV